jgi:hypothetical protein
MNEHDGLIWTCEESPALRRVREATDAAAKWPPLNPRDVADALAIMDQKLNSDTDYVGRHHIPVSDDVVVVYPVITVHEGEVLSVRYGSHYAQDEVAA